MSAALLTSVTSANANTATNTSLAVTLADTTVGHLNVVAISGYASGTTINPTMSTPSGWTKVAEILDTNGTPASWAGIYYRVYQSGDPATVTFSWTNAGQMVAVCDAFSAFDTAAPVPYSTTAFKVASDVNYSISGTTGADAGVLVYGFANRSGAAWSSLTDTDAGTIGLSSGSTMVCRSVSGVAGGTTFAKTATGSNTSVGVSWAYVVKDSGSNAAPTVTASADKSSVGPSGVATLTAVGADSDGTVAGYSWRQISGPAATLSATTAATVTATAPSSGTGTMVFGVTVTDNGGATSAEATVSVPLVAATVTPTPVASGSAIGNATSASVAVPAGVVGSDVLLVHVVIGNNPDTTITPPASATQQATQTVGTALKSVLYTVTGVTAGTTLTWALSATRQFSVTLQAYRNLNSSAPLSGTVQAVSAAATGGTFTAPALAQTPATVYIVEAVGANGNGTAISAVTAPASGGWTSRVSTIGNSTFAPATAIADSTSPAGGGTWTVAPDSSAYVAYTVALQGRTVAATTANAGPDVRVGADDTFTLDGTGTTTDATIATWAWTWTGPSGLTGAATSTAAGTAPILLDGAAYTATLTVTDSLGATSSDTATVTVDGTAHAVIGSVGSLTPVVEKLI